jgi:hypothetical protein
MSAPATPWERSRLGVAIPLSTIDQTWSTLLGRRDFALLIAIRVPIIGSGKFLQAIGEICQLQALTWRAQLCAICEFTKRL